MGQTKVADRQLNTSPGSGGVSSPGGSNKQVQYNNNGVFAGSSKIQINNNGSLEVGIEENPVIPPSGFIGLYATSIANRTLPKYIGPSGRSDSLQVNLFRNKIGIWVPPGNANTVPGIFGLPAATVVGTATARNVATTNLVTRIRRLGYVSANTAGALTEQRFTAAQYTAGTGTDGIGGFFYCIRFTPSNAAAVSGERFYTGLMDSTAAATNVEPNTLVNHIGIAQLSTDATQWCLVYGGTSAQTAIPCGTSLGAPNGLSNSFFELIIYAPSAISNTFYVKVTNIITGATFEYTLTGTATQIPVNTVLLAPKTFKTNNTTALAVAFDIASIYIETDN